MGPWIDAARAHARKEAERISAQGALDMRFAVVAYRDHPPQDTTFVTRVYPFGDYTALDHALNRLEPAGGGDEPEAVWDGVREAANLPWRDHADRLVFLIGDSPPHGYNRGGDGFPRGCPCGLNDRILVSSLCEQNIKLYAHSIAGNSATTEAFSLVSVPTGGECTTVDNPEMAISSYATTLSATSDMIGATRDYVGRAASMPGMSAYEVGSAMGWTPEAVDATVSYLSTRGLSYTGESIGRTRPTPPTSATPATPAETPATPETPPTSRPRRRTGARSRLLE